MAEQLEQMWEYAQDIAEEEDSDPTPPDFKEIDPEKVRKTAEKINKILKDNPKASNKAKAKLRYIEKNFPENLAKYEQQQKILAGRSSYSKTDPDATFMRMKEDHMLNGQLKPGYNVQISSESQFVIHYNLQKQTNNIHTLKTHLETYRELYEELPKYITADEGYGSEENYEFLEQEGVTGYVKYNTFDKEEKNYKTKKKKSAQQEFHREQLYYNPQEDYYVCPMGQRMEKAGTRRTKTKSGYVQTATAYKAKNCKGCPLRGVCHQSK